MTLASVQFADGLTTSYLERLQQLVTVTADMYYLLTCREAPKTLK